MENEKESPEAIQDEFKRRRGRVMIPQEALIQNPQESYLKALFSNFYPVLTEDHHNHNFRDQTVYYGFSPHFDIVEEGQAIPEYNAFVTVLREDEDKPDEITYEFDRFEKL